MKPSDDGDDLFDWVKKHTHGSDPSDTSAEAAEDAQRNASGQMLVVFGYLLLHAMTQDELRHKTGLGDNAAKRCSDLKNLGWVKDSGKRGLSDKGKKAVLWEPTEFGRQAYAAVII